MPYAGIAEIRTGVDLYQPNFKRVIDAEVVAVNGIAILASADALLGG